MHTLAVIFCYYQTDWCDRTFINSTLICFALSYLTSHHLASAFSPTIPSYSLSLPPPCFWHINLYLFSALSFLYHTPCHFLLHVFETLFTLRRLLWITFLLVKPKQNIFYSLLRDMFREEIHPVREYNKDLSTFVSLACDELGLSADPRFITKILQLNEILNIYSGVFIIGSPGSGKSKKIVSLYLIIASRLFHSFSFVFLYWRKES